jgi:hypothetical protein
VVNKEKYLNTIQSTLFVYKPPNSIIKPLHSDDDAQSLTVALTYFADYLLNSNWKHRRHQTYTLARIMQRK